MAMNLTWSTLTSSVNTRILKTIEEFGFKNMTPVQVIKIIHSALLDLKFVRGLRTVHCQKDYMLHVKK